jgi:hypothetical protein
VDMFSDSTYQPNISENARKFYLYIFFNLIIFRKNMCKNILIKSWFINRKPQQVVLRDVLLKLSNLNDGIRS